MVAKAALKGDLKPASEAAEQTGPALVGTYDEDLHERFVDWKEHTGTSGNQIARMISRSAALVSQYISKTYPGNIKEIEKDITSLLRREEDLSFTTRPQQFCNTTPAKMIWEVLQYCDEVRDMGVAVGPAGSGKTETCKAYKRRNRATIFITLDVTTRSIGAVLTLIAKKVGGVSNRGKRNSSMLHGLIRKLKDSRRLIVIDDAHFLTWTAFEALRKIHDCAGVGIVYAGQERLYDQMRGTSDGALLYDQIFSRIGIRREGFPIERKDVKAVALSLCKARLDKACIDFLAGQAGCKGRFRRVQKILRIATKMHGDDDKKPMNVETLEQATLFLMKGER